MARRLRNRDMEKVVLNSYQKTKQRDADKNDATGQTTRDVYTQNSLLNLKCKLYSFPFL
jgi:hypothetical protein